MPTTDFETPSPEQDEEIFEAIVDGLDELPPYNKPPSSIVFGGLAENLEWTSGESDGSPAVLTLSAAGDRTTTSQTLTELSPGEYYVLRFLVKSLETKGDCAHSIQLLLVEGGILSGWACTFPPGMDFMLGGGLYLNNEYHPLDLEFSSYIPGEVNTAVIAYDDEAKTIQFILNGELLQNWIIAQNLAPRKFKIRVTGLTVELYGE